MVYVKWLYNTCLFHIKFTSLKAQKYWLATSVLYFSVGFLADFFYNVTVNDLISAPKKSKI